MRIKLIILIGIVATISCCTKPNYTPEITYMNANPNSVFPGDTVDLWGNARDVDGGDLTLDMFYQGLKMDEPIWIAPKILGDHYIVFVANDGTDIVKDSISIHVKDTTGTFLDSRDQQEYQWIKIGQQIWMAENLAFLPSVSPPDLQSDTTILCYIYDYYGNSTEEAIKTENYRIYGSLYNLEAAKVSCPVDWHLPSDDEWKILELFLGMSESEIDKTLPRTSGEVGRKLKSSYGWHNEGNGDNSSGFNALPAGRKNSWNLNNYDSFSNLTTQTEFWTSTEYEDHYGARSRTLQSDFVGVQRDGGNIAGFSVRCLKNE